MKIFLSKYVNGIDKKGRVSVPAGYRLVIADQAFNGIVAYPSFRNECIEACSLIHVEQLSKSIEKLDPYSEERDAFETILLGEAVQLPFDTEGRIILPKLLLEHAKISDQVCFVGKGSIFEIWQPALFEQHLLMARKIVQAHRLTLKNV